MAQYHRVYARINNTDRRVEFIGEDTGGNETQICCVQQPGWSTVPDLHWQLLARGFLREAFQGEVREAETA